jgi:putative membrane protein
VLSTLVGAATVTAAPVFVHSGFAIGFFILGHVIGFIFLLLLIGLFARGMRRKAWHHGHGPGYWMQPSRSAEATLAERFANGDVDEKEYRARLEVLRANAYPPNPPKA